ncbi:hypothetical protein ASF20_09255 [Methylobacterium sp. Leaf88]|nr:hypothetical protein ASF20_09255 [Methylobacterium sp. Leaf88]
MGVVQEHRIAGISSASLLLLVGRSRSWGWLGDPQAAEADGATLDLSPRGGGKRVIAWQEPIDGSGAR